MPTTLPRSLAALATLIFLTILVRTAWISDDALITLRTVLNVTHGFGLTFNIAERVQTYTHPLWMALLTVTYLITGNVYISTFLLAIGTSVSAFWLAVARARSAWQAAAVVAALLSSRAFVDYSTSGLENPLSCLLLALVVGLALQELSPTDRTPGSMARRSRLPLVATLTSLLFLTRPDDVIVVLPLLGVLGWPARGRFRETARALLIGATPAILWTGFAVIYYGSPFPNTAYAKLGSGIPRGELLGQGVIYLIDSVDRDPLTLMVIVFAVVLGLVRGARLFKALALGVGFYVAYVAWIGGDFMTGRFLAVPFFGAVLLLSRWPGAAKQMWMAVAAVAVAMSLVSEHAPLASDSRFNDAGIRPNGVADERGVFFQNRSLVRATRTTFIDPDWPRAGRTAGRGSVVRTCGLLGAGGLDWGPYRYWLDECALADPLLARLPSVFTAEWRMAHFRRIIPDGYEESLATGGNLIADRDLHALYADIQLVTRAPRLFTRDRWAAILRLNFGHDDRLVNRPFYRHEGSIATLADLGTIAPDETPWDAPGTRPITTPLTIAFPERKGARYFDVALSSEVAYRITFLRGERILGTIDLGPIPEYRRKAGLESYTVDVPAAATARGLDMIVVARRSGDDLHASIGHLLLEGSAATDRELLRRVSVRDAPAKSTP